MRRALTALLVIAVLAWAIGFVHFANTLPVEAVRVDGRTDAIVVLTGGRGRLAEGLALLLEDRAKMLFVSGVYRGVDVAEILRIARPAGSAVTDRIALGHEADDTVGNALETANWINKHGFRDVRLVTAAYHMPRSLFEMRQAMPSITLVPHPVFSSNVHLQDWWRWPGTTVLLATEYSKFLLSRARAKLFPRDGRS